MAMIRAIGFGMGASGQELLDANRVELEDLADILNGMMNAGFVITTPQFLHINPGDLPATQFEVNPAYAREIRNVLYRKF